MQVMAIRDRISILICDIRHVNWGGNMTKDLKPNLFIIIKSNEFSNLKGFLKHDHLHNSHSQSQNNILEYKYSKQ